MLFYIDGLEEAHNSNREMFDTPRLKVLLEEHADGASLIDVLLGELTRFTGEGWEQEDDVTLVMLQRTALPSGEDTKQTEKDSEHLLRNTFHPGILSCR